MDGIISAGARVVKVHLRNDDDMVDRLHHRYTVLFLVMFTAVVSTTQYVGDPISCWCPAYFTENHVDYTNKVLCPFSVAVHGDDYCLRRPYPLDYPERMANSFVSWT